MDGQKMLRKYPKSLPCIQITDKVNIIILHSFSEDHFWEDEMHGWLSLMPDTVNNKIINSRLFLMSLHNSILCGIKSNSFYAWGHICPLGILLLWGLYFTKILKLHTHEVFIICDFGGKNEICGVRYAAKF